MLPISCIRCHRPYFAAAKPRPGVRCSVCRGRLEVSANGSGLTPMPIAFPPVVRAEPGSFDEGEHNFASLVDFVNDDPRRGPSRERDIGLSWLGAGERTFRAAWVQDTGELYLVQTGNPTGGGGHVELLGCAADEPALLSNLDGWDVRCGQPFSAEWLRTRARRRLEEPVRRVGPALSARRLSTGSRRRSPVLTPRAPS